MRNVRGLTSERVAILPPGDMPLNGIIAGRQGAAVRQLLSPQAARVESDGVALQHSCWTYEEREILIPSVKLEGRRMLVTVEGSSDDADLVADAILSAISGDDAPAEPVAVVYDTTCRATLDFDWQELFSPKLMALIGRSALPAFAVGGKEPRIVGAQALFVLRYRTPEELEERAVGLSPKNLSIAPEPQRPLAERRYVTQSPSRSEEHLRLLEELEAALVNNEES